MFRIWGCLLWVWFDGVVGVFIVLWWYVGSVLSNATHRGEIPAFAGMTWVGAGMTWVVVGMNRAEPNADGLAPKLVGRGAPRNADGLDGRDFSR